MRKFLVLVLIMVSVVACGASKEKAENQFLNLMRATDFNNHSLIKHFSDDFKTFFTGLTEYNIKSFYEFQTGAIIAEYYNREVGSYYFGFRIDPWGMDGSMYLYMSDQISKKMNKEELWAEVFSDIDSDIGSASVYY